MSRHQRKDSISNAHVGRDFEQRVKIFFEEKLECDLIRDHALEIGVESQKKSHKFDLGSEKKPRPIIIECKSHRWTKGGNVPSAKMTVWNEAMYYFYLAPKGYRKIFCCLKHKKNRMGETLARYYIKTYNHFIPAGVEIWEYCEKQDTAKRLL